MVIELSTVVIAASSAGLSVVGWLVIRAIKGVDKSIEVLGRKVDGLVNQDTSILIQLEGVKVAVEGLKAVNLDLRTRVTALELQFRESTN